MTSGTVRSSRKEPPGIKLTIVGTATNAAVVVTSAGLHVDAGRRKVESSFTSVAELAIVAFRAVNDKLVVVRQPSRPAAFVRA